MNRDPLHNTKCELRDAAENLLVYSRTGAVLLPIESGTRTDGQPEYVVAGSVADIRKLLDSLVK